MSPSDVREDVTGNGPPPAESRLHSVWFLAGLVILGILVVVVLLAVMGTYSYSDTGYGWMMGGGPGGTGWWVFMMLIPLLVFLLFVVLVVAFLVPIRSPSAFPPGPSSGTPEELLAMRYARGELSREEYLRMADDLRSFRH